MKDRLSLDGEKCPSCGQGILHAILRTEDFEVDLGDDSKVKVYVENVPIEQCDKCGEVLTGPAAATIRDEALCRAAGLLLPCEINALREKFGWSLQFMANFTGFPEEHISFWERGRRLQNRSEDRFLRALRESSPFREYFQGLLPPATMVHLPVLVSEQKAS